jgi:hypothetical protein
VPKRSFSATLDEQNDVNLRPDGGYWLYRSEELAKDDAPVINGIYVQRTEFPTPRPPSTIRVVIEW